MKKEFYGIKTFAKIRSVTVYYVFLRFLGVLRVLRFLFFLCFLHSLRWFALLLILNSQHIMTTCYAKHVFSKMLYNSVIHKIIPAVNNSLAFYSIRDIMQMHFCIKPGEFYLCQYWSLGTEGSGPLLSSQKGWWVLTTTTVLSLRNVKPGVLLNALSL